MIPRILLFAVAVISGSILACSEVGPTSPYDPESPSTLQKLPLVVGRVKLPSDYSSIRSAEATVEVRSLKPGFETTQASPTGEQGEFSLNAPTSGNLIVTVRLDGFESSVFSINSPIGATLDLGEVQLKPDLIRVTGRAERSGESEHADISVATSIGTSTVDLATTSISGRFEVFTLKRDTSFVVSAPGYVDSRFNLTWSGTTFQVPADAQMDTNGLPLFRIERERVALDLDAETDVYPGDYFEVRASGGLPPYTYSVSPPDSGIATIEDDKWVRVGKVGSTNFEIIVTDAEGAALSVTAQVRPAFSIKNQRISLIQGAQTSFELLSGRPPYTTRIVGGIEGDAVDLAAKTITIGPKSRRLFGVEFQDANQESVTLEIDIGPGNTTGRTPFAVAFGNVTSPESMNVATLLINDLALELRSIDAAGDATLTQTFPTDGYPTGIAIHDVDDDGQDELFVSLAAPNQLQVKRYIAQTQTLETILSEPSLEKATAIRVLALDGHIYLAIGYEGTPNGLELWKLREQGHGLIVVDRLTFLTPAPVGDLHFLRAYSDRDSIALVFHERGNASANPVVPSLFKTLQIPKHDLSDARIVSSLNACEQMSRLLLIDGPDDQIALKLACRSVENEILTATIDGNLHLRLGPTFDEAPLGQGRLCDGCGRANDSQCEPGLTCGSAAVSASHLTCRKNCTKNEECPTGSSCSQLKTGPEGVNSSMLPKACLSQETPTAPVCHFAGGVSHNIRTVSIAQSQEKDGSKTEFIVGASGTVGRVQPGDRRLEKIDRGPKDSLLFAAQLIPSSESIPETLTLADSRNRIFLMRRNLRTFEHPKASYSATTHYNLGISIPTAESSNCSVFAALCGSTTVTLGCLQGNGRFVPIAEQMPVPCPTPTPQGWMVPDTLDTRTGVRYLGFGGQMSRQLTTAALIRFYDRVGGNSSRKNWTLLLRKEGTRTSVEVADWDPSASQGSILERTTFLQLAPSTVRDARFLPSRRTDLTRIVIAGQDSSNATTIAVTEIDESLRVRSVFDARLPNNADTLNVFDCNDDGVSDFGIGAFRERDQIVLWRSTPTGYEQAPPISLSSNEENRVYLDWTTGDFDGDRIPDIAATDASRNELIIFSGHGNCAFQERERHRLASRVTEIRAADWNHDGLDDLVALMGSQLHVLKNHSSNECDFEQLTYIANFDELCANDDECGGTHDLCAAKKDERTSCTRDCSGGRACPAGSACYLDTPAGISQCIPEGKQYWRAP